MTDRSTREPVTERLFAGNFTRAVHESHDWGSLFCGTCGAWPDDKVATRKCPGPPPTPPPEQAIRILRWNADYPETVAAIEQESAARALAEARKAVTDLTDYPNAAPDEDFVDGWREVKRRVLAVLGEEAGSGD